MTRRITGRRLGARGALAACGMLAACGALALGCGDNLGSAIDDPARPLPARLSALDLAALDSYEPAWPLWSSGSDKARLASIPGDIDASITDAWSFPLGTVFVKTFAYGARTVETRILRLVDTGWTYDVYLWADDASDAKLVDLGTSVTVDLVDSGGAPIQHRVPSRLDCRTCHESGPAPVLGYSSVQLDPEAIKHADPTTREVLGMFQGNCVHCHNGGDGVNASFDLRHGVAIANIVNQPTASSASAAGTRVIPGDPEHSILFLAVSAETTDPSIKLMPPLGVDRRDTASIATLRAWISALTYRGAPPSSR